MTFGTNLGGSYSIASKGIWVHEIPTFPTCSINSKFRVNHNLNNMYYLHNKNSVEKS
jgi:hypothetical protein